MTTCRIRMRMISTTSTVSAGTSPFHLQRLLTARLDFLDDFAAVKVNPPKPDVPAGPSRLDATAAEPSGSDEPNLEDLLSDDEFAKQLRAGMADLLGEIDSSVSSPLPVPALGDDRTT